MPVTNIIVIPIRKIPVATYIEGHRLVVAFHPAARVCTLASNTGLLGADKSYTSAHLPINTLRPRQNGRLFADDCFKRIFLNENNRISIKISLKFVPKGPIINIPALVQRMAWRRSGDKPLSEPMMVRSLTHICVTRPQWVDSFRIKLI